MLSDRRGPWAFGLLPRDIARQQSASQAIVVLPPEDLPLTRAHWVLMIVLVVALVIDIMKPASLGFTIPGMVDEYGRSKAAVSLVPFAALSGTVVGSLVWGVIADLYGRKASILLSAVMFVGTAICAATPAAAQSADRYAPVDMSGVRHPEWAKDAVIYQINTRQFTPEGTFRAAERQLPRLKALGVDILWLMPIHPIGEKNRKGTLGSPYSVKDYRAVNPEFGTMDDFKSFVRAAHAQGMHVIIDWVANHSAWDNALVAQHPDWYDRDWKGEFRPTPWWDWSDIIDFDFAKAGIRRYMAESMQYWVREADIDGYRADVAAYVPLDFWDKVREDLNAIKPVFMLGEAEMRDLHYRAFDATYGWGWYKAMSSIAQGKADVGALFGYYSENESAWPAGAMRMVYAENHDENAWHGTQFEIFGPALDNTLVLAFAGEGIPLIYNGQEAGNPKRLKFFEKDPIAWRDHRLNDLFTRLIALKTRNRALWNAPWGARMVGIVNNVPSKVFSFVRQKDGHRVFAVFNFSAEPQRVTFKETLHHGRYADFATGEAASLGATTELQMAPWSYRLFTAEPR